MIVLESITPANALVFKEVRLRALKSDPTAFGSTYEKECRLLDEEWLRRSVRWSSAGSIGLLAFDGESPCGLIACYTEEETGDRTDDTIAFRVPQWGHVVSMWVDPGYRRAQVGSALIEGIVAWAAGRGLAELRLMVTSVNPGAMAFYERLGFERSGRTGPYPNDPAVIEHEMVRRLALSSPAYS
jgi:ribosomal protein S18 acetylase RimI-like enzyme